MTEFYDNGSAFQFQITDSDTEPGNPSGTHPVIAPHFRAETFFADFEKWIRNLYRCTNWHKCVNVDLLDNKHASDLQLTVAGGDAIDSPNLVEGSAIDITTSGSDITVAVDINELTSATVANGDEVMIADVDDGNALKKVTALSIAQLATGGDVSGPGSSTNNALALFDGTGGKTIQNSALTSDPTGNDLTVPGTLHIDTIELGGGSGNTDTTITRAGAGVMAVEGVNVLMATDILRAIVDGDDANTSTSPAATDHMSLTVEASTRYQFEAWLDVTVGSDGLVFDFDGGTATMTSIKYSVTEVTTTGTAGETVVSTGVTALATDVNIANTGLVFIKGHLNVNAAGTFIMRHWITASGTDTVHDGSWMRLTKVS